MVPGSSTLIHVLHAGREVSLGSVVQRSAGTGALSSGTQGVVSAGPVRPASLLELHPVARKTTAQNQDENERRFMDPNTGPGSALRLGNSFGYFSPSATAVTNVPVASSPESSQNIAPPSPFD